MSGDNGEKRTAKASKDDTSAKPDNVVATTPKGGRKAAPESASPDPSTSAPRRGRNTTHTPPRPATKTGKLVDWDQVRKEYETGTYSPGQLALMHGCSRQAVTQQAKRHGWVQADLGKVRKGVAQALQDAADGATEDAAYQEGLGGRPRVPGTVGGLEDGPLDQERLDAMAQGRMDAAGHYRGGAHDKSFNGGLPPGQSGVPSVHLAYAGRQAFRDTITEAVQTGVEVVLAHRHDIAAMRQLAGEMMQQCFEATRNEDDILEQIEIETRDDKDGRRRARMKAAVSLPSRSNILVNLASVMGKLQPLERTAFNLDGDRDDEAWLARQVPYTYRFPDNGRGPAEKPANHETDEQVAESDREAERVASERATTG